MYSHILTLTALLAGHLVQGAPPEVRELFRFPNGTQFLESVKVRSNGHLLINTFDDASMYTLNPKEKNPQARFVVKIPDATGLTGLAQIAPDVFAASAGVLNYTDLTFTRGSAKIVSVDLKNHGNGPPTVKTIAKFPNAGLLNGMAALPHHPHIIFSVDSKDGSIHRVNTRTGKTDTIYQDPRLTPGPAPKILPLGINGIKVHDDYLYLTVTESQLYCRLKISRDGDVVGDLETLVQLAGKEPAMIPDDFVIDRRGDAYIGAHPNSIVKRTRNGDVSRFVYGPLLEGPTATALSANGKTLYIVTTGSRDVAKGKGGRVLEVSL